jgi:DNA-directed RNA polymerase subunit E'/Rpb7
VAGTCSQRFGYVIAVTEVNNSGKGIIQEGTGYAVFPVTFTCIVMRPFKNEIFEAVVTNVTRMGIYAEIGPMVVLVSSQQMPASVTFDEHSQAAQFVNSEDDTQIAMGTEVSVAGGSTSTPRVFRLLRRRRATGIAC